MSLSVVAKYLTWTWEIKKLNLLTLFQYRLNLLMQVFGMFFNDVALMFVWVIFFKKFPQINGWNLNDTLLILCVTWFGMSLIAFFAEGVMKLSTLISNGGLDYYLVSPCNVLWHICVSDMRLADLGTVILTLIVAFIVLPFTLYNILLFILLSTISGIITLNFMIVAQSLPFYIGQTDQAAEFIVRSLFYVIYYPQSIFTWPFKFITTFILPIFFIASLPMQLIKNFDFFWFLILIAFAIASSIFAIKFFYSGLKRYESGNLLNVKL